MVKKDIKYWYYWYKNTSSEAGRDRIGRRGGHYGECGVPTQVPAPWSTAAQFGIFIGATRMGPVLPAERVRNTCLMYSGFGLVGRTLIHSQVTGASSNIVLKRTSALSPTSSYPQRSLEWLRPSGVCFIGRQASKRGMQVVLLPVMKFEADLKRRVLRLRGRHDVSTFPREI